MNKIKEYHKKSNWTHVVLLGAGASKACNNGVDKNGLILPLMNELKNIEGIKNVLKNYSEDSDIENFEDWYDEAYKNPTKSNLLKEVNSSLIAYFRTIRIPDQPTIYDYLLLSLRPKDLIATFNWDPLLCQAYQRNRHLKRLPKLAFLHGNVMIGACIDHKKSGFTNTACSVCKKTFRPQELLFPIKEKNYSKHELIKDDWIQFKDNLQVSYLFTIFGYSAPKTDIDAKTLLIENWNKNPLNEINEIEIIDTADRNKIYNSWLKFFTREHYSIQNNFFNTYLYYHPRRSCEAFFDMTMQCDPWKENSLPVNCKSLGELHDWIRPLIDEEEKLSLE